MDDGTDVFDLTIQKMDDKLHLVFGFCVQCFDMTYSDGDSQWECAGIQSGFADVSVSECAAYVRCTEMCGTSMQFSWVFR